MPKRLKASLAGRLGVLAIFAVPTLLLGIVIGLILHHWNSFQFEPRIALGQVLQTVTLLLLFGLANHYYVKTHETRKKTAEILVGMVEDVLTQVAEIHSRFVKLSPSGSLKTEERRLFDSAFRGYSNLIVELADVLRKSNLDSAALDFDTIQEHRQEYKNLITDSPYPQRLPTDRIVQESKLYVEIRSHLRQFQLRLV